jgi:hypothetical protein
MKAIRQFLGHCVAINFLILVSIGCALLRWLKYQPSELAGPLLEAFGNQAQKSLDSLETVMLGEDKVHYRSEPQTISPRPVLRHKTHSTDSLETVMSGENKECFGGCTREQIYRSSVDIDPHFGILIDPVRGVPMPRDDDTSNEAKT